MLTGVSVKLTGRPLTDLALVDARLMREVGLLARERMVTRTQAGLDAEGRPFAPYSREYADQKSRALGSTRVDLQVSGIMLQSLQVVAVTDDSVTIGIGR